MSFVLRHLKEWHPDDPFPYRVYWDKKGERFPYDNKPHSMLFEEMQNFIIDQDLELTYHWESKSTDQYKNWNTTFHTGFRFRRQEDAMMFLLRFNGDANTA
jgi:hypothetical protein